MAESDFEKKRKEAAQVYAGMTDGELEELAGEAWSLTEIGKEALRFELARRGLQFHLAELQLPDEVNNLVTIRKFRDLPDALLANGVVESADIECFLADSIVIRMNWFWSNLLGGIKLRVRKEDADDAIHLLDLGIPEVFDVAGVGEFTQPRCPNCRSLDISFNELNRPVAYVTAYLGVPIPVRRRRWKCNSCDHVWRESDEPPQPPA